MLREVVRPGGVFGLLAWLARRVAGHAAVLDSSGRPVYGSPELPGHLLEQVTDDLRRVAACRVGAASADVGRWSVCVVPLSDQTPGRLLVLAGRSPFSAADRRLATEAAHLLGLRCRVDDAERRKLRLEAAEAHNREAVLHLLMMGHVSGAKRVAATLRPQLPDLVRVYVVEYPANAGEESVRRCETASGGRAWVVRCPVHSRHLIVLAPVAYSATSEDLPGEPPVPDADVIERELRALAAGTDAFCVGSSHPVHLRETARGYRQAFHALAVAKNSVDRYARFSARGRLCAVLGPSGREWATSTLEPLLDYVPERRQDPDSSDLLITLASWLNFYGGASRQLKIHRNTLALRLRHIEQIIGCDLSDIKTQATIHLALQLLDLPSGQSGQVNADTTLDALLDRQQVRDWAYLRLSPLLEAGQAAYRETLKAWLEADANLSAAARELGISPQAARKRLTQIERLIKWPLLTGPSARYDMWFALRAIDAATWDGLGARPR